MNELFATFKAGSSVEDALDEVYGLSRLTLENAWRESVGLPPREEEEDRSTAIEDEVIGGPEVAEEEEQSEAAQESEPVEEEQAAQEQQAAPASNEDEPEAEVTRSDAEIAERVAEIERRQQERRAGPVFEVSGPFPWEYPLIGVAAGLLLLNGALLLRILSPRSGRPSP